MFITAFTSDRYLSLSWARSTQSMPPPPFYFMNIQLNIILPSMAVSPKWSLPLRFPTKTLCTPLLSPTRAISPAHLILFDLIARTILGEQYRSLSSLLCSSLNSPVPSSLLGQNISPQHPILRYPQPTYLPQCQRPPTPTTKSQLLKTLVWSTPQFYLRTLKYAQYQSETGKWLESRRRRCLRTCITAAIRFLMMKHLGHFHRNAHGMT